MNKFNLEKALSGAKVITRDGREVTEIHYFKTAGGYNVCAVIENNIILFTDDGIRYPTHKEEHALDLFMAPEKHEVWINVYRDKDKIYYAVFETRKEADRFKDRLHCFKAEFEL